MYQIEALARRYNTIVTKLPQETPRHYKPSSLIILSGVSGSGKTTIGKILEDDFGYGKLRNVYTRSARPGETEHDGIFIDLTTFQEWQEDGRFITTRMTNGYWHGFTKDELARTDNPGTKLWADKSVGSIQKLGDNFHSKSDLVYIVAPSFDVLFNRIISRNNIDKSLSDEEIILRFAEEIEEFEQSMNLPYRYVMNDGLENVISQIGPVQG